MARTPYDASTGDNSSRIFTRRWSLHGAHHIWRACGGKRNPSHVHLQPLSLRDSRDGLFPEMEGFAGVGIGLAAINSNDVDKYPQDNPEKMRELKMERDWSSLFSLTDSGGRA